MALCNAPALTKGQLYTNQLFHFSQFSALFLCLSDVEIFTNFTLYPLRKFTVKLIPFLVGSYLAVDHVVTSGALCLSGQGSVDFLVH